MSELLYIAHLYTGTGYDCAGQPKLNVWLLLALAFVISSATLTLGATLPTGSIYRHNHSNLLIKYK